MLPPPAGLQVSHRAPASGAPPAGLQRPLASAQPLGPAEQPGARCPLALLAALIRPSQSPELSPRPGPTSGLRRGASELSALPGEGTLDAPSRPLPEFGGRGAIVQGCGLCSALSVLHLSAAPRPRALLGEVGVPRWSAPGARLSRSTLSARASRLGLGRGAAGSGVASSSGPRHRRVELKGADHR